MSSPILAIVFSAFIFPGIGQLYKGEVRKGVFLILSASLLLAVLVLGMVMLYSYGYAAVVAAGTPPEAIEVAQLQDILVGVVTHPFILFTFGLLLATWVYGFIDAGRRPSQKSAGG